MTPGSPDYMAPEQTMGTVVTGAADQYALGVVVYEALGGRLPFRADTPMGVLVKKQTTLPPDIAKLAPGVPEDAARATMRTLERDPAKRFKTCAEFAKVFRNAARPSSMPPRPAAAPKPVPIVAVPAKVAKPPPPPPRRSRALLYTLIALVFLAGAGFVGFQASRGSATSPSGPPREDLLLVVTEPPPFPIVQETGPTFTIRGGSGELGGLTIRIGSESVRAGEDGRFEHTIQVPEGRELEVVIQAVGTLSVSPPVTRKFRRRADLTPPVLEILEPKEEVTTISSASFTIRGMATGARLKAVRVGPTHVPIKPDGTFEHTVAVGEGEELVVTLEAEDEAGNKSGTVARRLRRERAAAPWEAALAAAEAAAMRGDWDAAERSLEEARKAGVPQASIPEGLAAGVRFHQFDPILSVDSPVEGAELESSQVTVRGTIATNRATDEVHVNGVKAVVEDGRWHATIDVAAEIRVQVVNRGTRRGPEVVRRVSVAEPESDVPSWAKVSKRQMEEAKRVGVPVAYENRIGMRFVLIPAGTFQMGEPGAQTTVEIPDVFYMQEAEVTNGQYRRLVRGHKSESQSGHTLDQHGQPVVRVNRAEAMAFAQWLDRQGDGHRYRLPTEQEWEYAARAGTTALTYWGAATADAVK
jgi:hypothetical protein